MGRAPAPPGWYDDPPGSGNSRWWDGNQWTHHTLRTTNPVRVAPNRSPSLPWWRTKLVLLVPAAVVWLFMVIGLLASGDPEENLNAGATTSELTRLLDEAGSSTVEGQGDRAAVAEAVTSSTAAPTSATEVPTTAAPTTPAPTTTAPTTAAPTTTAPTTTAPTTAAPTTAAPTTTAAPAEPPGGGCHPAYSPCLPNHPSDALNCGDLSGGQKPVTVNGADPYGLDGDNDGVGCESG